MASMQEVHDEGVRFGRAKQAGYFFNQRETIIIIDLYYNSKFQNGIKDKLGQRKIFMNVGKFRCDVCSKQIDLEPKDFRFVPDDYADPYTAFFMEKDFHEWAKEASEDDLDDGSFGDLINKCVDAFPRYGSVVLKKVKNRLKFVPLQNLYNEQSAKSLQIASYVIEEHSDMYGYEIQEMKKSGWNVAGFNSKFNQQTTVYERHGRVPLDWLKRTQKANGEDVQMLPDDSNESVEALVICALSGDKDNGKAHVFYAAPETTRPYREKHFSRQNGRWLGIGLMEDLFENQEAKNIIINLERRSLHWSSKRIMQSTNTDVIGKNLVRDVSDGEIIEVGAAGAIQPIDLSNKAVNEFQQFLNEWETNANQKAFTYEASLLNSSGGNSKGAFRLAAFLSQSAQAYFARKRRMLQIFLRGSLEEFIVPQFIKDMGDEKRVISMFEGDRGFSVLKNAAMQYAKDQTEKQMILNAQRVDAQALETAAKPFSTARTLFFEIPKDAYKNAKAKFDIVVGEDDDIVDLKGQIANLTTLYQALAAQQDPRAEKVLERISELTGVDIDAFGAAPIPKSDQPSPVQYVQQNPEGAVQTTPRLPAGVQ